MGCSVNLSLYSSCRVLLANYCTQLLNLGLVVLIYIYRAVESIVYGTVRGAPLERHTTSIVQLVRYHHHRRNLSTLRTLPKSLISISMSHLLPDKRNVFELPPTSSGTIWVPPLRQNSSIYDKPRKIPAAECSPFPRKVYGPPVSE